VPETCRAKETSINTLLHQYGLSLLFHDKDAQSNNPQKKIHLVHSTLGTWFFVKGLMD
jgi:hypothetical protein